MTFTAFFEKKMDQGEPPARLHTFYTTSVGIMQGIFIPIHLSGGLGV